MIKISHIGLKEEAGDRQASCRVERVCLPFLDMDHVEFKGKPNKVGKPLVANIRVF